MAFTEAIIIGICSSLVASVMFLLWTRLLTPKIEISRYVSVYPSNNDDERDTYRIKIINRRFRSASDLTVSAYVQHLQMVKGGHVKVKKPIGAKSTAHSITRRRLHDTEHDNCRRVRLNTDELEDIYLTRTDPTIVVEVYCRDSWSGVGRVLRQEFALGLDGFKHGSFIKGMTCEIEPYAGHKEMVLKRKLREKQQSIAAAVGTIANGSDVAEAVGE